MSRIDDAFARLRAADETGLVTFVTGGDPDHERSSLVLRALDAAGADVLEVGVPFSDPLADGPVIQRASERALAAGATLTSVLDLVAGLRDGIRAPIVLFTYVNPILRLGLERFATRAAGAGIDGVLAVDLPIEEGERLRERLAGVGVDTIFLVSPTTTAARLEQAAALGRGFLYGISRLGVTGARTELGADAARLADRLRRMTALPIAIGFGVSHPDHVRAIGRFADAAVVGSALVSVVAEAADAPDLTRRVGDYLGWLKRGSARRTTQHESFPRG